MLSSPWTHRRTQRLTGKKSRPQGRSSETFHNVAVGVAQLLVAIGLIVAARAWLVAELGEDTALSVTPHDAPEAGTPLSGSSLLQCDLFRIVRPNLLELDPTPTSRVIRAGDTCEWRGLPRNTDVHVIVRRLPDMIAPYETFWGGATFSTGTTGDFYRHAPFVLLEGMRVSNPSPRPNETVIGYFRVFNGEHTEVRVEPNCWFTPNAYTQHSARVLHDAMNLSRGEVVEYDCEFIVPAESAGMIFSMGYGVRASIAQGDFTDGSRGTSTIHVQPESTVERCGALACTP